MVHGLPSREEYNERKKRKDEGKKDNKNIRL